VQALSLVHSVVYLDGVFVPLEVALNQVWGFPRNRPYWRNQLVSFGWRLAVGSGAASVALTAATSSLEFLLHGHAAFFRALVWFWHHEGFAIAASVGFLSLIYWALPNGKVPPRAVLLRRSSLGCVRKF